MPFGRGKKDPIKFAGTSPRFVGAQFALTSN